MFVEILKAILFGIVEGITEWLPISSTGHMILLNELVKLELSPEFWEFFLVVIQLGAILAVVVLYFRVLNPFDRKKSRVDQTRTWRLIGNIIIACFPAGLLGVAFDTQLQSIFNFWVVASMLILYGIIFIILENYNNKKEMIYNADLSKYLERKKAGIKSRKPKSRYKYQKEYQLTTKIAIFIGLFQCLSLVPGTSRSGVTILGAMIVGCNRKVAAEFSFFLAIPVMIGASLFKSYSLLSSGYVPTGHEYVILIVGIVTAFVVSFIIIKNLLVYIRKHDFRVFGWYRIALGIIVLAFFLISKLVA